MRFFYSLALAGAVLFCSAPAAEAHFGMIIPSTPAVSEMSEADIALDIKFWHPFENVGMNMEKPRAFRYSPAAKPSTFCPGLRKVN